MEQVNAYKMVYTIGRDKPREFLTLDKNEIQLKTFEVMQIAKTLNLNYLVYETTKPAFLKELRRITGCV